MRERNRLVLENALAAASRASDAPSRAARVITSIALETESKRELIAGERSDMEELRIGVVRENRDLASESLSNTRSAQFAQQSQKSYHNLAVMSPSNCIPCCCSLRQVSWRTLSY